ncbi:uncharacterized protein [Drosophila virilis]|uniref:Uncharacterized protein n=1 Tax=Drosophila virilis TaxID=7244 RepID=B4LHP2_DROVI|nr:uncharacterized protein LOC6623272 [Drosophila virilis]EDW69595.1 uncharacterized protein Dvir_GJ13337 [Drosophila virilis]
MICRRLHLLLCLSCLLCAAQGAQVYMEFNGQKYAYNTDAAVRVNDLSPNYELPGQQSKHWPYARVHQLPISNRQWDWVQPQHGPHQPQQQPRGIDFSTQHMSHTQHTDDSGIVLGKYSYYDAAGYHELSYKAGAGIGFVVMGGNLAKPTEQTHGQTVASLHSY